VTSLAVVIVDYYAGPQLAACVDSYVAEGVDTIVVVDNSTTGASGAALEGRAVSLVEPQFNLGFGRGVNRGVATSGDSEIVLVSNPDLFVQPGAVSKLVAALTAHPEWAAVGPTIIDDEGSVYPSVRIFPNPLLAAAHALLAPVWPTNPWTRAYRSPGRDGRVDWISGACFAIRRTDFERIGGFDERYFMFAEDMDLCWRLGQAGRQVGLAADAVIVHHEGVSRARAPRAMLVAHHRSAVRFELTTARGWRRVLVPGALLVLGLRFLLTVPFSPRGRS
jgi:N-acetylglucosaminyl-diphospho-decaprenol L-rhamnosyltransferase